MTVAEKLRHSTANSQWFYDHLEGLRANAVYRDRYVAVSQGRIVAVAKTYPELLERLYNVKPEHVDSVFIERVTAEPCAQLL